MSSHQQCWWGSIIETSSAYMTISIYLLGHKAQFYIGPAVLMKRLICLLCQHSHYYSLLIKLLEELNIIVIRLVYECHHHCITRYTITQKGEEFHWS